MAILAMVLPACGAGGETRVDLSRDAVERLLAAGGRVSLNGRDLGGLDLSGLRLDGADLSYATLAGARLSGASLRGALLWAARATGADFSDADLRGAKLGTADLSGANLAGADLRGADLQGTNFGLADLRGADLRESNAAAAILTRSVQNSVTRWPTAFRPAAPGREVALGPADAGRQVELRSGDAIAVRLPEDSMAGRQWQVAAAGSAALGAVASLIHQRVEGSERVLVLEARAPGQAALRLLRRPVGGGEEEADAEFKVGLVVRP